MNILIVTLIIIYKMQARERIDYTDEYSEEAFASQLINCITALSLPFEVTDNFQFQRLINLISKTTGKSIILSSKSIRQQLKSSVEKKIDFDYFKNFYLTRKYH
jgi:hypothetical protein